MRSPDEIQENGKAGVVSPLFRPEALAAQRNSYGEVLRIRPLSWPELAWICIGLAVVILGGLFVAGHVSAFVWLFGRLTQ